MDTHPSLWDGIERLAERDRLKIAEQVYLELQEKTDAICDWCKSREDALVAPATDATEERYTYLVNKYSEMAGKLGTGNDFADLYVVALAMEHDATVVTKEGFDGNQRRAKHNYKITDVCFDEGIEFIMPYKLLAREGWVFNHL